MPHLDFYPNRLKIKGNLHHKGNKLTWTNSWKQCGHQVSPLMCGNQQIQRKLNGHLFMAVKSKFSLRSFQSFFSEILPPERAATVQKLWTVSKAYTKKLKQSLSNIKTESARRWSNKWTKTLYQDYLHCIANFCRALLIIFSKQFISSNTKRRKRMLNFV